jgi:hypothetical protein
MSKKMGSIVVGYGVLIVVLAFTLQQVSPPLAKVTFIAGLVAGGLSVLWGIVGLAGHKRRTWAMLTLVAFSFVSLTQVIDAWSASASETPGKLAGALLLTLLMFLTVGMMMYLMHGDRPPEFYRKESARRSDSELGQESAASERGRQHR